MLIKDFYKKVALTEQTAVDFLRERHLLTKPQEAEPCELCGSPMKEKRKRDRGGEFRPILRCPKKGCQTTRSVRKGNAFFYFTDINNTPNSKLSLCDILELVFFFVSGISTEASASLTGKSLKTVVNWFNLCREVCGAIVAHHERLGTDDDDYDGPADQNDDIGPIPIFDSRSAGHRKVTQQHPQSYSDHVTWMALRKSSDDKFIAFLDDIQSVYR